MRKSSRIELKIWKFVYLWRDGILTIWNKHKCNPTFSCHLTSLVALLLIPPSYTNVCNFGFKSLNFRRYPMETIAQMDRWYIVFASSPHFQWSIKINNFLFWKCFRCVCGGGGGGEAALNSLGYGFNAGSMLVFVL